MIVVNAEKVVTTGKKLDQKKYYHHSEYVGGMKEATLKEMMQKKPEFVITHAVKECFQRDLWDARCLLNCMYTQDQSTTMLHRNQKFWIFNQV